MRLKAPTATAGGYIRDKAEKEGDLKQQPERWDGRHDGDTRVVEVPPR